MGPAHLVTRERAMHELTQIRQCHECGEAMEHEAPDDGIVFRLWI